MIKINGREIKLFILDVDGVITKFDRIIELVIKVAKELGLPSERVSSHFKKVRRGDFPKHFKFKHDVQAMWPNLSKSEIAKVVLAITEKEKGYKYEAYGAVYSFLFWLQNRGAKLAICTRNNHKSLSRKLKQANIREELFGVISVPGKYSKPQKEVVDSILQKTGTHKDNAVFVGDMFVDVDTARNSNILFIGTTCGVLSKEAFLRYGVPEENIVESLPCIYHLINENENPVS